VALPPLRPAAFFWAVVPPREDVERERDAVDADRDLEVPVDREVVERDEPVLVFARDFAAVARPPLAPAAFFCAVVPPRLEVERARLVPEVDLALLVPDVEREREVVERDEPVLVFARDLAAVARPPFAPAAFFFAVVPLRLDDRDVPPVDRLLLEVEPAELRDVPDVDRERVPLVERRGVAARTRETAASAEVSSATDSAPKRSGIELSPIVSAGRGTASGSRVKPGSPNGSRSSSRLSPSK
jgi:hypothetical protein